MNSPFLSPELKSAFEQYAKKVLVEEDTVIMQPGNYIKSIPVIIKGCIRVIRRNKEGEETFLYHLMPGDTCAFSLTCCSVQKPVEIKAVAEEETEFWSVNIEFVEAWQQYKEWREFIALTYQTRFNRLLQTIDNIAFENLDVRIWKYLLERATVRKSNILKISHEEIAQELNIQREAATRLIRKLKDLGYVETGRNQIKILKQTETLTS